MFREIYKLFSMLFLVLLLIFSACQIIGSLQCNRQQYLDASPINFVNNQSVPTTFFHGDADNVVPIA